MNWNPLKLFFFFIFLIFLAGCATYKVEPSDIGKESAVSTINSLMKSDVKKWHSGPIHEAGADDISFKYFRAVSSSSYMSSCMNKRKWTTVTKGALTTKRYSEIEDITVTGNLLKIFMFFILDPTSLSTVNVKFKNGASESFTFRPFWDVFPFYFTEPNWVKVHKAARAFEELRIGNSGDRILNSDNKMHRINR